MDAEAYHVARREERRSVIEAIESVFPQKNFSMCSLGSGFGGEESLLLGGHVALTLVEPDERHYQFLRRKFPSHVSIVNSFFQFCRRVGPYFQARSKLQPELADSLEQEHRSALSLHRSSDHGQADGRRNGPVCRYRQPDSEGGMTVARPVRRRSVCRQAMSGRSTAR